MNPTVPEIAKRLARDLRRRQTIAEGKLWTVLRNRQFLGKKFLRQHPIIFAYEARKRFFVADFFCHENKLVVEVDGKSHDYQKDYDELRTYIINGLGMRVVRFKNEDIENKMDQVLDELKGLLRDER